jgi:thymidylate synthase
MQHNITNMSDNNPFGDDKTEWQYLDLVRELIRKHDKSPCDVRPDRTGVGTVSVFGRRMEFELMNGQLPLLTTKRVSFKNIVNELLWMLRGSTSAEALAKKGTKIWLANSTREFLDSRGLKNVPTGELGPVYGSQWRNWGGQHDQIATAIEMLKHDPYSRRIMVSAWNVDALDQMALPPCHSFFQFYVEQGADGVKELSLQMYQRSGDMFLGVPYNIAFYSTMCHLFAHHLTSQGFPYRARKFVHILGDAHLYLNHIEQAQCQVERVSESFPTLVISPETARDKVWDYDINDFNVENYTPKPSISAPMAI